MKTIKELIDEKFSTTFSAGYNQCREDILELIDDIKNFIVIFVSFNKVDLIRINN